MHNIHALTLDSAPQIVCRKCSLVLTRSNAVLGVHESALACSEKMGRSCEAPSEHHAPEPVMIATIPLTSAQCSDMLGL